MYPVQKAQRYALWSQKEKTIGMGEREREREREEQTEKKYTDHTHTVIAEILVRDLISYISYFWLKVRKLVAYESLVRIPVYVTPPSRFEIL